MQHRVLIVGGARQSKRLAGILEGAGYTEVHLSFDCEKAIEAARSILPDVVIMDAALPCEDPIAIARRMLDERPVPIILHSSFSQIEQVMKADEAAKAGSSRPLRVSIKMAVRLTGTSTTRGQVQGRWPRFV